MFSGGSKRNSGKKELSKHAKQQAFQQSRLLIVRDRSRNRVKFKKELFATIEPLTIAEKCSFLNIAGFLHPSPECNKFALS